MRKVTLSIPVTVLALCLGAAQVSAQQPGRGNFQWYIGGHGGVTSFRSPLTGREYIPMAGGDLLITARRTGLLISVDQGFGSDELTFASFEIRDSLDNVVNSGDQMYSFQGLRRYSATLLAYPVKLPNIQPYVGVGLGIVHTTSNSLGPFADGSVESHLSSSAFLSGTAGLEFRLGPFSAFGQYQVTTKHGYKQVENVLQRRDDKILFRRIDFGQWTLGAYHTLSGGLRFSLGSARERAGSGGY
ncbi:MAG TPA: hypothetical protein VFH40_05565 [Gemmatimonadales bacterium]|jgi:hypothetical protein|nr:hypothetical protein [Gemmatimonadales bacterium]